LRTVSAFSNEPGRGGGMSMPRFAEGQDLCEALDLGRECAFNVTFVAPHLTRLSAEFRGLCEEFARLCGELAGSPDRLPASLRRSSA
jgi:hypothetical protein